MRFSVIICIMLLLFGCTTRIEEKPRESRRQVQLQRKDVQTKQSPVLLGEWTTRIINRDEARVNNISLAVSAVNDYVLASGEEFSFNQLLGERTAEKGYKEADIFVGDETEKAIGGGICQLSSTLYMAAKNAGLSVTERHAHSQEVAYAKEGEDACVNYGSLDFRFVNTKQASVRIAAFTDGTEVTVQLWDGE